MESILNYQLLVWLVFIALSLTYKSHSSIILTLVRLINMDLKCVGERIRFLRTNNLKLSQEDFAKSIELDRTYLSRVEAGKQNLTLDMLFRICEGLKVSLKEFFDY